MGTGNRHHEPDRQRLERALGGYRLHDLIGEGAFASVYRATHTRLGRPVAVKVLSARLLDDRQARARFAVEARLLASLDDPHVVRVYDYLEGDVCALVMEWMRGGTMRDQLAVVDIQPPGRSCKWVAEALAGRR